MVFGSSKKDRPVGLVSRSTLRQDMAQAETKLPALEPQPNEVQREELQHNEHQAEDTTNQAKPMTELLNNTLLSHVLQPVSLPEIPMSVLQESNLKTETTDSMDASSVSLSPIALVPPAYQEKEPAILLPALNSAQSLASSVPDISPEAKAMELRLARSKALEKQHALRQKVRAVQIPSLKALEENVQKFQPSIKRQSTIVSESWTYPREQWSWWLAFGVSTMIYMGVSTLLIWAYILDENPLLYTLGVIAIGSLIASFFSQYQALSTIQQCGIRLTSQQFPEMYSVIDSIAKKLGIRKIPPVYILNSSGLSNKSKFYGQIQAKRLLGQDVIIIPSDWLALTYEGHQPAIAYLLAREFAKIKRGYLRIDWLVLAASLLPGVGSALSQAKTYTTDRMAAYCQLEGALAGLLLFASGAKLYPYLAENNHFPEPPRSENALLQLFHAWALQPPLYKRFQHLHQLTRQITRMQSKGY